MSKLDKLLKKFNADEPSEDDLIAEFIKILSVDDDCFQDSGKNTVTKENYEKMRSLKTYLDKELEIGDVFYFAMLREQVSKRKRTTTFNSPYLNSNEIGGIRSEAFEMAIKLVKISEDELPLFMLLPEHYLRRIIILNQDNQTYSIDRSLIKKISGSVPHLILKMSEEEVKESDEFIFFKYVKKHFKKSNKK